MIHGNRRLNAQFAWHSGDLSHHGKSGKSDPHFVEDLLDNEGDDDGTGFRN